MGVPPDTHHCSTTARRLALRAAAAPANAEPDPEAVKTADVTGPRLQPTERVLKLWRKANAVCFDVDCELTWRGQISQEGCLAVAAAHQIAHLLK